MIREESLKPFPAEHACRLSNPDKYDEIKRKNNELQSDGKRIDVIYGIKDGKSEIQAYRYPKDIWTGAQAKKHCKEHNGILFEEAEKRDVFKGLLTGNKSI